MISPGTNSNNLAPSDKIEQAPQASNLLARALNRAIVGPDGNSLSCEISSIVMLLSLATSDEVVEADKVMRAELGYGINSLVQILKGGERERIEQILIDKQFYGIDNTELPGDRFRREYICREFERANIFPKNQRAARIFQLRATTTIDEKLNILEPYIQTVIEGCDEYPEILRRWVRGHGSDSLPYIERSICNGRWVDLRTDLDALGLVRVIKEKALEALSLVDQFRSSKYLININNVTTFIGHLDFINRFAMDYAMDFYADSYRDFETYSPKSIPEKLFKLIPSRIVEKAWNGVFNRFVIIKRALGIGEFVEEMRVALNTACAPTHK